MNEIILQKVYNIFEMIQIRAAFEKLVLHQQIINIKKDFLNYTLLSEYV